MRRCQEDAHAHTRTHQAQCLQCLQWGHPIDSLLCPTPATRSSRSFSPAFPCRPLCNPIQSHAHHHFPFFAWLDHGILLSLSPSPTSSIRPGPAQGNLTCCAFTHTHAHRLTTQSFNSLLSFIPCPDSRSNSILPFFDSSPPPRAPRTLAYPTPVDQSIPSYDIFPNSRLRVSIHRLRGICAVRHCERTWPAYNRLSKRGYIRNQFHHPTQLERGGIYVRTGDAETLRFLDYAIHSRTVISASGPAAHSNPTKEITSHGSSRTS